jgi:hypothetical protein
MRGRSLALGLLLYGLVPAAAQQVPDTTVTVQGFLQQEDGGELTIVLPLPLTAGGYRTFVLVLTGKADRWKRLSSSYVEASGRLSLPDSSTGPAQVGIEIARLREVEPPGTTRTKVNRGMTLHAEVALAVIPNRFAWRDARDQPTGVNPVLLYSLFNNYSEPMLVRLTSDGLLCVRVTPRDGSREWTHTTASEHLGERRIVVTRGGAYRTAVALPVEAAPRPGRYVARAGICSDPTYDAVTEFDIE